MTRSPAVTWPADLRPMDPLRGAQDLVTSFGDAAEPPHCPGRRGEEFGRVVRTSDFGQGCYCCRRKRRSSSDGNAGAEAAGVSGGRQALLPLVRRWGGHRPCACAMPRTPGARNAGVLKAGWHRRLRRRNAIDAPLPRAMGQSGLARASTHTEGPACAHERSPGHAGAEKAGKAAAGRKEKATT